MGYNVQVMQTEVGMFHEFINKTCLINILNNNITSMYSYDTQQI